VEIEEMLRAALDSAALSSPNSGGILVSATRSDLAADLRSFGEEIIAGRIASLSEAKLRAIFERAGQLNEVDPNLARKRRRMQPNNAFSSRRGKAARR
jgi:hypothetical protein